LYPHRQHQKSHEREESTALRSVELDFYGVIIVILYYVINTLFLGQKMNNDLIIQSSKEIIMILIENYNGTQNE